MLEHSKVMVFVRRTDEWD